MSKTTDMTKGKITGIILSFFFPMLITNMLQQIYTVADTAIVGKGLGDDKLAAVGNMASLTFLIFGFATGLSNGFSVIIAQKFGSGDIPQLKRSVAATLKLFVIFSVILTALSVIFLKTLLNIMQTDQSIMKDGLIYGYIIFGGLVVTLGYNLCSGILRALGDSKTPLYAIISSSVINILLDLLFIFIIRTGVEGAAAATVISQLVSTGICFRKLCSIDEIRFSKTDLSNCTSLFPVLILNGIPMALMNSITAIGCVVLQYFVNGMGVAYTSAYSAVSRIINLFMQPACTAGFTMSSFTSQNFGAKEYKRIRSGLHVCLTIALISYIILGSVMIIFPRQLAMILLTGKEPISLCAHYLPVTGIMLFAVDFLFVYRSGVQAMGKPTVPMISGIAEMILRVIVVILFVNSTGFNSTAYAQTSAWSGAFIMNFAAFEFYLKKYLKEEAVINEAKIIQSDNTTTLS